MNIISFPINASPHLPSFCHYIICVEMRMNKHCEVLVSCSEEKILKDSGTFPEWGLGCRHGLLLVLVLGETSSDKLVSRELS